MKQIDLCKKKDIGHIPLIKKKKIILVYSAKDNKRDTSSKKKHLLDNGRWLWKKVIAVNKKKHQKPMIKINEKPIIENIIFNAKKYGFTNIYISVHHLKKKIIDYFKDGKKSWS